MELYVLDENYQATYYLDTFESLLWAERYNSYGDFEIYTTADLGLFNKLKIGYYLVRKDSDYVMIIEDIQINSDVEDGNELIITGRSLESILERRIVWYKTWISGNFQDGIEYMLNEAIITPEKTHPGHINRKIDNFIFERSDDPLITSLTIDITFRGENLYEAIETMCKSKNVGFKITLNENNQFVFKLYAGVDRSYDQDEVPYVIFAPNFDNIINSNYVETIKPLKTLVLIDVEDKEGIPLYLTAEAPEGGGTGLNRREMYLGGGISSTDADGNALSDADYKALAIEKGKEELAKNIRTKSFEGEVETSRIFRYNEDFFIGDIVQIANEYGIEAKTRVVEVSISQDIHGIDIHPTFETVE